MYLFFSVFFLLLGLFRGEIFSSIAGILLCLYFFYAVLAATITLFFWKNEKPIVSVQKNEFIILPFNLRNNKKNNNSGKKNMFPLIFPGCSVQYVFDFRTEESEASASTECIVNLRRNSESEVFAPKKRGKYFCKYKFLRIIDIAHCYEFILPQSDIKNLPAYFVFPRPKRKKHFLNPPLLFADDINKKKTMQRNDELYDVRQYFPGDDTRKINWKVYAHLNDLTIRQGEFLPPPQKRFSVFVDSPVIEMSELAEFEVAKFDVFINRIATFLLYMIRQNYSFNFAVLENNKIVFEEILSEDNNAEERLLRLLSVPQVLFKYKSELKPNISVFELTNSVVKNEGLIYFMYANSGSAMFLPKIFSKIREKTFFYVGPNFLLPEKKSFVHRFLFETKKIKNEKKIINKLHTNLGVVINDFKKERYYAEKI
ncbi:MAG: hypothetical protein CR988_03015 [Treponema sp.]|nr:MAG: hypothetical protein CR988_03015 [Treponema sp.]